VTTNRRRSARLILAMVGAAMTCVAWAEGEKDGRAAFAAGDYAQAAVLLRPEAEAGDREARFILGFLHDTGRGVEQDPAAASSWYRLAAEDGHARAQYNLALALAAGRGVERDPAGAAAWLRRAAEQDFGPAQFALGDLLARGDGAAADPVEAHTWFALAERHKIEGAKKRRRALADAMNPREIALAEMAERHWKQRFEDGGAPATEPPR
jgi:TPR repeat protein